MTDQQREAEIRRRAAEATPGPWTIRETITGPKTILHPDSVNSTVASKVFCEFDADFIAHTREDVPWLLSLLDAARQQLAERDKANAVAIGLLTEWLLDVQDNLTSTPRGCDSWQPQKDLEQRILTGLAALEGR